MMTHLNLDKLKKRGLTILRMEASDWHDLEQTRGGGARFTEVFPHYVAREAKARSPVLIVVSGGPSGDEISFESQDRGPQLKLAWVGSVQAVATRQSRVAFQHVMKLSPEALDALLGDNIPSRFQALADKLLESTRDLESLSPKFGQWILDRVGSFPANHSALRRLDALVRQPSRFDSPLALQQDALGLALRAFGAPAAQAEALVLGLRTTALATVRAQENLVIEHDARWIPGWKLDDSDITGRAVFHQGQDELQVFTANREDLERVFGVDLIYLNQRRRSIVMVQYKMLEPLERKHREVEGLFGRTYTEKLDQEWVAPINEQFKKELARMEAFDQPISAGVNSYRMASSPFFFKLVRRNGSTNGAGILLSLGHLQMLRQNGELKGPKGGLRIAYSELQGHYLRSDSFVELVQSGYIGSHSATTEVLETLIEATLAGGRSVVAAIQTAIPPRRYED